jgi:hypothetical protein
MSHGALTHEEMLSAILLRMEVSREALLAVNSVSAQDSRQRRNVLAGPVGVVTALGETPRVGLVLALCVAAIAFGPRRTIMIAGRSALTAWLAGSVRKLSSG